MDWAALARLRAHYLDVGPAGDYWRSRADLEAYDQTFAQRIGWKWDAVLPECASILDGDHWTTLDWGCGTGIATRRLLECCDARKIARKLVWDRSRLAVEFAREQIAGAEMWDGATIPAHTLLLLSHVIGELDAADEARLLDLIGRAAAVIWVEPGTPAHARRLVDARERLRQQFFVVAPCTHAARCGLHQQARDWCHFFASPPPEIFRDHDWAEFSKRLGIDLRALPVSFIALSRSSVEKPPDLGRVIGRPRLQKGVVRYDFCSAAGVAQHRALKRDRALHDRIADGGFRVILPVVNEEEL